MNNLLNTNHLVIDVESVGLRGKPFAIAGILFDAQGLELEHFCFYTSSTRTDGTEDDKRWVQENVTVPAGAEYLPTTLELLANGCYAIEEHLRDGATVWADCAFPVETSFFQMARKENVTTKFPYPLHEIATVLLLAGRDPTATCQRLASELPAHNPLQDCRQSGRLLFECLRHLNLVKDVCECCQGKGVVVTSLENGENVGELPCHICHPMEYRRAISEALRTEK